MFRIGIRQGVCRMNYVCNSLSNILVGFSVNVVCLLCLLSFGPALCAQSTSATLSGTVMDPTGKVVPETDVSLTNIDTNIRFGTKTNEAGIYVLPNLPPGRYRLIVTKQGFKQRLGNSYGERRRVDD
jgi:hypothetical protein